MGASRAKIGVGTLKSLASDTKMTTQLPMNLEEKAKVALMKYLKQKKRQRSQGRHVSQTLKNGVPCKLDNRGNAIIDPLTQPPKVMKAGQESEIDPTSINQPFFVIEGENGSRMIYREDSIKNLMNNSIVRYNDSAVLDVSLQSNLPITLSLFFCQKAKKQMGTTVRFQFSCVCKGGRANPRPKLSRTGKSQRQKVKTIFISNNVTNYTDSFHFNIRKTLLAQYVPKLHPLKKMTSFKRM